MIDVLKIVLKQPYWIIALLLGVLLVMIPCVTVDKDHSWSTHPPTTGIPVALGAGLIAVSLLSFGYNLLSKRSSDEDGLDFTRVKETKGVYSTAVNDCEIRVIEGRIDECKHAPEIAVALPCNEYFDDRCAYDVRSALGAYVTREFQGQAEAFVSLFRTEASRKFGKGTVQQKTETESAESFGTGRCVVISKPLGKLDTVALISTTTQRAGQGLAAQISCLFDGVRELGKSLADVRVDEVIMPVLGGGHGGIHPPLAFIGLVLAVAEAARYGHGTHRLRSVTIVVFKRDENTPAEVDRVVIRRALALIGSQK